MVGMSFLEFNCLEDIQMFCNKNSYKIITNDGVSIIANVYNKNNALVGYISNSSKDFRCKNKETKYVLVWE